jgi:hypothetical protein
MLLVSAVAVAQSNGSIVNQTGTSNDALVAQTGMSNFDVPAKWYGQ